MITITGKQRNRRLTIQAVRLLFAVNGTPYTIDKRLNPTIAASTIGSVKVASSRWLLGSRTPDTLNTLAEYYRQIAHSNPTQCYTPCGFDRDTWLDILASIARYQERQAIRNN